MFKYLLFSKINCQQHNTKNSIIPFPEINCLRRGPEDSMYNTAKGRAVATKDTYFSGIGISNTAKKNYTNLTFWIGISFFFIFFSFTAQGRVVPKQDSRHGDLETAKKFSHLFSLSSSTNPYIVGSDFELELSLLYQNLDLNKIYDSNDNEQSKSLLEPLVTLRKGLYWNLDLSFSTALPTQSNLTSGYSVGLSHTSKFAFFILKPELYIFQYNLNDSLDISGTGLTLVLYTNLHPFYVGIGGNAEQNTSEMYFSPKNRFFTYTSTLRISYLIDRVKFGISINSKFDSKSEASFYISTLL